VYFIGIETSCDETAAAVFTDELRVLSNVVASQTDLHARFGGVVPEIASRAHLRNLLPVIDEALSRAGIGLLDVGCVAVHHTPGLVGALLVGVSAAKMLALALGVPLIGVNHIHGHVFACRLAAERDIFPCVGLVVSGGHTALFRCDSALSLTMLGGTRDDAAGEAFDKVAAILGLGFPGGPAVEREAAGVQLQRAEDGGPVRLPRAERGEGRAASAGEEAGRPGREFSGGGRGRAGRQVSAGSAAERPWSAGGRRRGIGEQVTPGAAGGDVFSRACRVVHPAVDSLYRQRGDGGPGC